MGRNGWDSHESSKLLYSSKNNKWEKNKVLFLYWLGIY